MSVNKASLLVCLHFVNQSGANTSELVHSSSAYESQVTIKTLVQSETIGKIKIPSFLCKSSLAWADDSNDVSHLSIL